VNAVFKPQAACMAFLNMTQLAATNSFSPELSPNTYPDLEDIEITPKRALKANQWPLSCTEYIHHIQTA
jgi:hypothetical protein